MWAAATTINDSVGSQLDVLTARLFEEFDNVLAKY